MKNGYVFYIGKLTKFAWQTYCFTLVSFLFKVMKEKKW